MKSISLRGASASISAMTGRSIGVRAIRDQGGWWVPEGTAPPFNIETAGQLTPVRTARSIALSIEGLVLATLSLALAPTWDCGRFHRRDCACREPDRTERCAERHGKSRLRPCDNSSCWDFHG